MAGSPTRAVALALLLAACGGESRRAGHAPVPSAASSAVPDDVAVFSFHDSDGPAEYRVIRRGQESTELLGYSDGFSDGDVVLSPDRRHAYLHESGGSVIASLGGGEQALDPNAEYWPGSWSPDGARFAALADGLPVVIDASGEHRVPVEGVLQQGAYGRIVWAPDGSRVAFGIGADVVIALADASTATVVSTGPDIPISDVQWSLAPVWSPDSSTLALISNQQELVFLTAGGSWVFGDSSPMLMARDFGWSQSGAWFAVKSTDDVCFVVSPDLTTEHEIAPDCSSVSWSPVDDRLLFKAGDAIGLWSESDGVSSERWPAAAYWAQWSPDGSIFAYWPSADPNAVVLVDSESEGEVTRFAWAELTWNPAGTRLLLMENGDNALPVLTADARGGAQQLITDNGAATWLPYGEYVAFMNARGEVLTSRSDGSEPMQVFTFPPMSILKTWVEPAPLPYR
jgi:hypothetical protein